MSPEMRSAKQRHAKLMEENRQRRAEDRKRIEQAHAKRMEENRQTHVQWMKEHEQKMEENRQAHAKRIEKLEQTHAKRMEELEQNEARIAQQKNSFREGLGFDNVYAWVKILRIIFQVLLLPMTIGLFIVKASLFPRNSVFNKLFDFLDFFSFFGE